VCGRTTCPANHVETLTVMTGSSTCRHLVSGVPCCASTKTPAVLGGGGSSVCSCSAMVAQRLLLHSQTDHNALRKLGMHAVD
jgi:hypothetical protein